MIKKLVVNGKELKLSPKAIKEMKELRKKIPGMVELEKLDKKLRHKPVKLYCLGCGKIISDHFTGGLWDYTHFCNERDDFKKNIKPTQCRIFGSELGLMIPSSIICGYKSFDKCKECKDELTHVSRVLEDSFGKGWKKVEIKDEFLKNLRMRAVLIVTAYASKEYGKRLLELYKLHPEWKI